MSGLGSNRVCSARINEVASAVLLAVKLSNNHPNSHSERPILSAGRATSPTQLSPE